MKLQQLETIQVSKEEAHEKWQECITATKKHNSQHLKDLKKVYYHLKSGKKVVDIYNIFKKFGLNEDGDPKLAICKADAKVCYASKQRDGSIRFRITESTWYAKASDSIDLPKETFDFTIVRKQEPNGYISERVHRPDIKTSVPIVPADKMPESALKNFYILWDVKKWELAPPKDPLLLRKLTANLFLIEAKWGLTKLERAVIRGRLE